ncbi:MAG: hypothetical protein ACLFM0_00250 [Spirochaetales bacterium]
MGTDTRKHTDWVAIGSLSFLAALIFQTGVFFLLFPAPLQFLRGKTDRRHLTIGCGLSAVFVAIVVAWRAFQAPDDLFGAAMVDGLVPIGLICAVWVLNELRLPRGGRTASLAVAGLVATLAALPSATMLVDSEAFRGQIASQLSAAEQIFSDMPEGVDISEMFGVESPERLVSMLWLRTFAGGFTLTLGLNYLVGGRLSGAVGDRILEQYRSPSWLPFVLLAGLAGVVVELSSGPEFFGILGWNTLIFSGGVFAAQGVGLLQFLVGADGKRPGRRALVPLVLMLLFVIPLTGGIVALVVPSLGLFEHWTRRRDGPTPRGPQRPAQ